MKELFNTLLMVENQDTKHGHTKKDFRIHFDNDADINPFVNLEKLTSNSVAPMNIRKMQEDLDNVEYIVAEKHYYQNTKPLHRDLTIFS